MYIFICIPRILICFFVIYIEALTLGQPYRMSLQLEMPDSPTNRELGMFMIKTTCFSQDGEQVASSARSVSCTHTHSAPARLHAIKSNSVLLTATPVIHCCTAVCFPGKTSAVCLQLSLCEYSADAC